MEKETGGAAFPRQGKEVDFGDGWIPGSEGMTLRDYFAARLMPEIYREYADQANAKNQWDPEWQMHLAVGAYRLADAMLLAREL